MKKDVLSNCKTLLPHYASSSKSIDNNRTDLASLRLLGSGPLVSVQIEMRSMQGLATNKPIFWRVRYEVPSPDISRTACSDRKTGNPLAGLSAASANNMTVLPGVLGYRTLRRTVEVRSDPTPCGCPARGAIACAARGTLFSTVSRRKFARYPG